MAAKEKVIDYDKKEDTLYISARKSSSSIEVGEFIIDLDSKGFVTGLEILNASKNLNVPKTMLSNIFRVDFRVKYHPEYVILGAKMHLQEKEIINSLPLQIDLGHKKLGEQKLTITA